MQLNVAHQFLPKQNSTRAAMVMDHFGIGFEQGEHVIARDFELPVSSGEIVLFTGESGSGKSSLMRTAARELEKHGTIVDLDRLRWEEKILVDLLPIPLEESLQLLASCGLGEAHLMLRSPAELSDGQRYRFRLALALAHKPDWILADEFTATLDRRLAQVIAANLRKVASRSGIGFLLATTHEDVVENLSADVHVRCHLGGQIELLTAANSSDSGKKKGPASPSDCGSPQRPSPTGRISLGGITAAITSG